MKIDIVESNSQRLRVEIRTNVPLYVFFGLVFIVLGIWCMRQLAVEARIVVEQQLFMYTNTCLWIIDCGNAEAAAQDVRVTMAGHEIQVDLPGGVYRLALPASDGDEKTAIARDLKAALARPGASYRHEEGAPIAALLLGLVCIGGGLVILSVIQWVSLSADRDAGTLELTRRLRFRPRSRELKWDLADLDAVLVKPSTLKTGKHIVTSYSVLLQMRGPASRVPVGITFLPMFTERDAGKLARIVRTWMNGSYPPTGMRR